MLKFTVLIVVIAVALRIGFPGDVSIPEDAGPVLGDTTYNMNVLDAPVATGFFLNVLSNILARSVLGAPLRRHLLKNNNFHRIRALSAQVENAPPLTHPINRHPATDIAVKATAAAAASVEESLLEQFFKQQLESADATAFAETHPRRTVRYYHNQYKGGVQPSHVMAKTLKKIKEYENTHKLFIFTAILPDEVMAAARESDARYAAGNPLSVLDGVPIGVKDMIYIKGHINYNGKSPAAEHAAGHVVPDEDDTIVRRLREAGAIILGGTVMTEGGVTPLGWSAHFQGPYNVYNFDRYSGGSSSGCAVAVATGIVPVAIGFDGGGSVRIPASMSGVHGLGVTFGRVPFDVGLDTTMIKPGPLAATAEDVAITHAVIAQNKKGHFYSEIFDGDKEGPPTPFLDGFNDISDLSDVRIGYFKEMFDDSDEVVRRASSAALEFLKSRGATLVDIRMPHLQELSLSHASKIATEFALKFDTVLSNRPLSMEPNTKITIGLGSTFSSLEVMSGDHMRAWAFKYMNDLYAKHNIQSIVNPTIPMLPPHMSDAAMSHGENNTPLVVRMLRNIFMGNYLGFPGYSVPVGYARPTDQPISQRHGSGSEIPIGLHFQGRHWDEAHLLRLARAIEADHLENTTTGLVLPPVFYDPFDTALAQ